MLIICPKCFAKYEVDTEQFDEETHIFQCSSCGKRFEERVHFDDEKNENKQTVPPAFITEQPILAPLSESDYISSNRMTMNFAAQSSVILPEEFTPVSDTGIGWGRKLAFVIVVLCMLGLVGLCAYIWLNKAALLKKYPKVQKAVALIMDDKASAPLYVPNESMLEQDAEKSTLDIQEVVLTPIEKSVQEPVQDVENEVQDRILPVEGGDDINMLNDGGQKVDVETPIITEIQSNEVLVIPQDNVEKTEIKVDSTEVKTESDVVVSEEAAILLEGEPVLTTKVIPEQEAGTNLAEPTVKDIQIRDVSFKYDQVDTETRLFVQGVIFNVSDQTIKMPPLQVQLFDTNGTLLGVKDLPYGEAQMPPQSDEFFFYELSDVPAGVVAKIEVVMKG